MYVYTCNLVQFCDCLIYFWQSPNGIERSREKERVRAESFHAGKPKIFIYFQKICVGLLWDKNIDRLCEKYHARTHARTHSQEHLYSRQHAYDNFKESSHFIICVCFVAILLLFGILGSCCCFCLLLSHTHTHTLSLFETTLSLAATSLHLRHLQKFLT